jgi:hypothetical protein|tara:strand:+ start:439 stop:678 length:240 start_codon:yes stop_codon:yes gene_type:complete
MEYSEKKSLVLKRVPPGDKWMPVNNKTQIFESLTEGLEWSYQNTGCRDYHLAAFDGEVYSINKVEVAPEPTKTFSLYGE